MTVFQTKYNKIKNKPYSIHLFLDFLSKNRWILGGVLFILCVVLQLHGSSIGLYADFLGHPELNDVLLGKNRPIRSDEWNIFTPFAFSQYYNNFSMLSNIVRGTATNMFITYGQAVWDVAMIYRPAQWGYLFLSPGAGLSFFWMGRWIILFLVSFEFSWRILAKDKKLSVCYASMMAFSPLVQWWFSINSIVEIIAAGQAMVIFWQMYLSEERKTHRIIYGTALLWSIGIYIMGLYPAWQVPFGYVFLALLLWVSYQNKNALCYIRKDVLFWIPGLFLMLAPILHVIYISWDVIQITKATEYPGARFELGGNWPSSLSWTCLYSISLFLPFKDIALPNNCELANFFSLSPLGLFLFFYLSYKKRIDSLMLILTVMSIILVFWALYGFPAWLAKISMMYNVPTHRAKTAADFINLLLLYRGAYLINVYNLIPTRLLKVFIACIIATLTTFCIWQYAPDYITPKHALISMIVITVSASFFLTNITHECVIWTTILMIAIGGTVNPLAKGTNSVFAQPIGHKIAEITSKDNSPWIVECELRNYPIIFGAPTINSVNTYPNLTCWEKLDNGINRHIYNRYAHIPVQLINQDSSLEFNLIGPDAFYVKLRPSDLNLLGVKYILTKNMLESLSTNYVSLNKIYEDHDFRIYEVEYIQP